MVDSTGTVVWKTVLDAFGAHVPTLTDTDPDGNQTDFTMNLRLAGHYYDAESGAHYNHFRYFLPWLGRYNRIEPLLTVMPLLLQTGGSVNTYTYAQHSPTANWDPDGLVIRSDQTPAGIRAKMILARAYSHVRSAVAIARMIKSRGANLALRASKPLCRGSARATSGSSGASQGARNFGAGYWVRVAEAMSPRAAQYQARFGRLGRAFRVRGVRFDGISKGVLQEAKGPGYANFVRNGSFQPWFNGAKELINQARRQIAAAGGRRIQWHFAEKPAADATRSLFKKWGIRGIEILFTP